jgi:spore maturation protein CgeB
MIGSNDDIKIELANHLVKIEFFDVYKIISDHKLKLMNFDLCELHKLYLSHSKDYEFLLERFKRFATDKEIIIFNMVNFIHPDWLICNLSNKTLVYGCIDDPITSYSRTSGSIFAYDGVFHFSLGYDEKYTMREKLNSWGAQNTYFWPPTDMKFNYYQEDFYQEVENSFNDRIHFMTYVGLLYGTKFDRLARVKKYMGDDLSIYGRWPLGGYAGFFGPIRGRKFLPHRVTTLTDEQRKSVYLSTLVSLNMHLSTENREFGNLRVFESIRHGMLLLSDKGGKNVQNDIFVDGKNAVFYDDEHDLFDKTRYLMNNRVHALDIAKNGFDLARSKFDAYQNFKNFMQWCVDLKKVKIKAY